MQMIKYLLISTSKATKLKQVKEFDLNFSCQFKITILIFHDNSKLRGSDET